MPVFHKNCYGQTYVLHEGKTKTGKPRYYMSVKTEGDLAEAVPEGYEIYERPGGGVYYRKIQKTPILPHELKYVQDKIAPLVDQDEEARYAILGTIIPGLHKSKGHNLVDRFRTRFEAEIRGKEIIIYKVRDCGMPMMKFVLCDEETREYDAHRWCFKGRIDDWIELSTSGQLQDLADKYCPALGTDDFYELW